MEYSDDLLDALVRTRVLLAQEQAKNLKLQNDFKSVKGQLPVKQSELERVKALLAQEQRRSLKLQKDFKSIKGQHPGARAELERVHALLAAEKQRALKLENDFKSVKGQLPGLWDRIKDAEAAKELAEQQRDNFREQLKCKRSTDADLSEVFFTVKDEYGMVSFKQAYSVAWHERILTAAVVKPRPSYPWASNSIEI